MSKHTLKFAGEGIVIEAQSITHGNYATEPESPERDDYNFEGWFIDNLTFTSEWNFKTYIVTRDTTLYAKWGKNTFQN
ncbi:InlB B-repeat-containing protein, partial [Bacteroidales bacterium OttesenSCG-928-I21]|nr:InlB B-repeat-containing protein [Bacteroidales bacterium OttesenSCG-928-I21]